MQTHVSLLEVFNEMTRLREENWALRKEVERCHEVLDMHSPEVNDLDTFMASDYILGSQIIALGKSAYDGQAREWLKDKIVDKLAQSIHKATRVNPSNDSRDGGMTISVKFCLY